jgi:photosystem II stability/assembly factor-like uncharacterized protein
LLLLTLPAASAAAEREEATTELLDWLQEKAQYFEAHPERTEEKGSGWKPYNRHKWFVEKRMYDGELPAAGARWAAWEERQRRIASLPRSTDTWFNLGPANLSGRMLGIAFDPTDSDIVYGGSAGGGLWKSTDGGSNWVPLTDELPSLAIGGVAVAPSNGNIVVIGTGEGTFNIDRIGGVGILRSTDAGSTWQTTNIGFAESSGHGFHFVEANPLTGTMLAGSTSGLYRSTDDGATWSTTLSGGAYYSARWQPGSNRVYTVRRDVGVRVSTDDGVTWGSTVGPSGGSIGNTRLAVSADEPDWVYAMYVNDGTSALLGVYRSTDAGATWNLQANSPNIPGGQGWYNLSLDADPNDATRLIAGGIGLYRSTDAGVTFSGVGGNVHVDHHVARWEPGNDSAVWVGSDGGLWRSPDDGNSFGDRNDGLITYQFYDICVNRNPDTPYYVMGGTQDNGTDKYGGTTTWAQGLGGDGMVCNIHEVTGETVFAETQFGSHYKSTTSGDGSWSAMNNGITGSGQWVTPVGNDPNFGRHCYTETSAGIFRTVNGMTLWENVSSHRAVWIDMSRVDGNITWTTHNSSGTRYTTDDGATWTTAAGYGFSTGNHTKIHAHPTDAATALVTFSSYSNVAKVAMTTDMGASWTNVSGNLPNEPVNAIVLDPDSPDDWYIGTDTGVWKSTDGGNDWVPLGGASFPNTVVDDLEISHPHRKLVAGTHGRGAWELDIPLVGTDVAISEGEASGRLMLDRPFPNPVQDRVLLRFAARAQGPVSLAIYDVQGRLVSALETLPEGDGVVRTTPWFPDHRANGVYFAVLRADGEQISRKVVVLR